MKLRFFVDHCISNFIIKSLCEAGYEVLQLWDYLPTDSEDSVVILKAQELSSILVSLNWDFADIADIITYPPAKYKGIISIQVRNYPENIPQIMGRLLNYLSEHPDMDYFRGKLFLVDVCRIRE